MIDNRIFKDTVKTKYAESKGIDLLRIKYTQFKTIDKLLDETLNKRVKNTCP